MEEKTHLSPPLLKEGGLQQSAVVIEGLPTLQKGEQGGFKTSAQTETPKAEPAAETTTDYADYPEVASPPVSPTAPDVSESVAPAEPTTSPPPPEEPASGEVQERADTPATESPLTTDEQNNNVWHDMLPALKLTGMAQQLAEHCLFKSQDDNKVILVLDQSGETLKTTRTTEALQEALNKHYAQSLQLEFVVATAIGETPEKRRIRLRKERQRAAEQSIAEDPVVQELKDKWGGVVLPGSIKPNKDVEGS